jgi:hypothetical protein
MDLHGRDPADLRVAELKLWLQARKQSVKGKKADLVARYACSKFACWLLVCDQKYQ